MIIGKIEDKRMEMLKFAKSHGLTSKITIQCSQELDKLLNKVQKKPHIK
ncbi:aspartyl-phosphate phosphatase Spo0E family protein [Halalkalibacter sp. APA_J-10(15)]|nr:aspartyl-phosphate phosphatase Spo0E family protein [Halalkalibacter sp. APA_J-10(15)]MCK0472040.1 aspartyl-phosphate phosphatase Spo0E family protein [Halalkalibacter sp. APA_J-10(15)]